MLPRNNCLELDGVCSCSTCMLCSGNFRFQSVSLFRTFSCIVHTVAGLKIHSAYSCFKIVALSILHKSLFLSKSSFGCIGDCRTNGSGTIISLTYLSGTHLSWCPFLRNPFVLVLICLVRDPVVRKPYHLLLKI